MANKKKQKKFDKAFIKLADKQICIDDLIEAVNQCDKKYGIRLKHPEIWKDPSNYINILGANCDMLIASMICIINGIKIEDYFETDNETGYGTICNPIGVSYPLFTNSSILNWDDFKTTYNTDSLIFRCRYITLVLSYLLGRVDKITYNEIEDKFKYKHSKDERRIILTKDIINDFRRFMLLLIQPDKSYKNIILKIHEHLSYGKNTLEQRNLRNNINLTVLNLRKGMEENLITGRFLTDDLAIYNTINLAYMLATNKTNIKVMPKFKYIEGATVKHNLIKLIEELGLQIIRNTKDKKYNILFKAYIEARPSIWTQFYKEVEENYAIQIGILALGYTKFVLNDPEMDDFIEDMMKKGK